MNGFERPHARGIPIAILPKRQDDHARLLLPVTFLSAAQSK